MPVSAYMALAFVFGFIQINWWWWWWWWSCWRQRVLAMLSSHRCNYYALMSDGYGETSVSCWDKSMQSLGGAAVSAFHQQVLTSFIAIRLSASLWSRASLSVHCHVIGLNAAPSYHQFRHETRIHDNAAFDRHALSCVRIAHAIFGIAACKGVHSIDRWKQDASWKQLRGELNWEDFSLDKWTKQTHLHCT